MSRPDPTLVSIETFRKLVQAAPGEIESLLKSGTLRRAAPGKLALIEATRSYIAHVRATARDASAASAMADAKAARAEASELSLAIQDRTLIRDEEADAALLAVVGSILETFGGLSARVSRDRADRGLVEDALRAAQEALADELAALPASPDPSTPTPARPSRARSKKGSTP